MEQKYILITGLMGSGKSTILLEYMLNFKTIEFTKPDVEAKFQGSDFEFIDHVFAIRNRKDQLIYNFYELDAPTIKRWIQFITAAHGIIIVANDNPFNEYSTPKSLLDIILEHAPKTPILIVASNYDDFELAKVKIIKKYETARITAKYEIVGVGKGKEYFDDVYGKRFVLENEKLKNVIEWHLNA